MELGGQLGPHNKHINPSIQARIDYQKFIHILILHHKGYQWVTKEWGICQTQVTSTSPSMSKVVIAKIWK
jgi:hypothetical protein